MNFKFVLLIFVLVSCSKKTHVSDSEAQISSILVAPIQTDSNYSATDESHYVLRNNKVHANKLLMFIGGSFSVPKNYNLICDYAASIGFDVISLSYPNDVAAATLSDNSNPLVFDTYRDEICFGNQVSNEVSVDRLNSIEIRTIKLLSFLKSTYPDQNWEQYLSNSNTLEWTKMILAGHSQGSGHAAYIAKKELVDRVIMLSGPNDYSTHFSAPANWLLETGMTPLTKQYSLLHTKDEIVPFAYQVANLIGLGLLTSNQIPTPADNLTSPYNNARSLSISIPAFSNHNSTVGANAKLPAIWTYMLTNE